MRKIIFFLCLFLLMMSFHNSVAQDKEVVIPLRFDFYYDYERMVEAMKLLNETYPDLTKLEEICKSEEGRGVYVLTINNSKSGNELDKPGVYVDGNIHGNEIQAAEVCLYLADYLLGNYGTNDKLTKLVDKNVFYIIPSINVDGRYHFLQDANTPSSNRGLRIPKDDDRDGLFDEDFPDDLDGDGNICQMRIKDPNGDYKIDPEDERLLVRIKPGEKGEWRVLGYEGIDNDGDGRVNEDSEGYVDPNRNWGYSWAPEYIQGGSGDFPFSGNVTYAVANFMTEHPNISIAFAFHNNGGLFVRGPGTKDEGEYNRKDVQVYDFLGENAERVVPGYKYIIGWKDMYSTYGDFDTFAYKIIGAYAFVGELFMRESESFTSRKEDDKLLEDNPYINRREWQNRERLKFNDHLTQGDLYKPWKKYNHPTYGEIEIGGWVKMSSRLPHPFMLQELVHRNASAVIFAAEQTPEISMEIFEINKIENDLYRLRIRLTNSKALPSLSYHFLSEKIIPHDILKIYGPKIKVIAGGKITDVYRNKVDYKEHKPELQFLQVPGHGYVEYQFLISGSGETSVDYSSIKAGKISKSVTIK